MNRARNAQDRAAQWIIAREEPGWSETDERALDAWLAESDMNRIAYLRLEHSWRESDRIGSLGPTMAPEALRAQSVRPGRRGRRFVWASLAAAASIAAMTALGWHACPGWWTQGTQQVATTRYDTKIGEHELVGLADGSKIELNTASAIRAAVDGGRRKIWLDRGEAYFEVAHDESRPFVVYSGSRQVTVLGTKFAIRRDGEALMVAVREGRVRLEDVEDARPVRSTTIASGDIAIARGQATLVTAKSEAWIDDALAWRQGMLSFDRDRLADVAAEFNRYNRQQIILGDQETAALRIGGMFPASKPGDFVRLLRDAYGLRIEEKPETIRISS